MRTIRYINIPRPRQMFLEQFPLPPIRQVLFKFNWALFDYCPPLEGLGINLLGIYRYVPLWGRPNSFDRKFAGPAAIKR